MLSVMTWVFAFSAIAYDPGQDEALNNTIDLLNNPASMERLVSQDQKARDATNIARGLAGGDDAAFEELFRLASMVFRHLMVKHGGDMGAVQLSLRQAKNDPKAFFTSLPASIQQAIQRLGKQIKQSSGHPS